MRRNVFTKTAPKFVGAWVVCALAMLFVSNGSFAQAQRSPTEPEPRDVGWAQPTISDPTRPYLSAPSAFGGSGSGLAGTTPIRHESAKLTASDLAPRANFGISVAAVGGTMLVGARKDACPAGPECGSAFVFRFNGSRWVEEQKLTASDAAEFDWFGGAFHFPETWLS